MPRDFAFERQYEDDDSAASSEDLSLHPEPSLGLPPAGLHAHEDDEESEDSNNDPGILDEVDAVGEASEILAKLHPYGQVLTVLDVDSVVALEEAAFEEGHRASREKIIYRLTRCGELCFGLFTSAGPEHESQDVATASTANAPDSTDPKRKGILLGHIIATKTTNDTVTDDDMAILPDWENRLGEEHHLGHKEHGRTILVHSLAILPAYQRKGLGTILMKAYIQRVAEAETADRIAILTYDKLIAFYEGLMFTNKGESKAQFGGGGWHDMVLEFDDVRPKNEDDV